DEVALDLSLYHPSRAKAPSIDEAARLEEELRARLRPHGTLEGPLVVQWRSIRGTVRTKAPLAVLPWMPEFAAAHALSLHLGPRTPYPVEHVIARLHADVAALRRERRARRYLLSAHHPSTASLRSTEIGQWSEPFTSAWIDASSRWRAAP